MPLNQSQEVVVQNSIPVLSLLGAAMVLLKLLGFIDISWWWVLCPFWFPIAAVLGVLAVIAVIAGIVFVIAHITDRS